MSLAWQWITGRQTWLLEVMSPRALRVSAEENGMFCEDGKHIKDLTDHGEAVSEGSIE